MFTLKYFNIFVYFILLLANRSCGIDEKSANIHYDLIIIGAGAAGLVAAANIYKNNVTNIIILEGSNRTGGRILTEEFGGYKIDLGPTFVSGIEEDLVYNISNPYDVFMDEEYPTQLRAPGGNVYASETYDGLQEMFYRMIDSEKLAKFGGPYKEYLTDRMGKALKVFYNSSDIEIITDVVVKIESSYFGESLAKIGTKGLSEFSQIDENQKYWKDGYEKFIQILMDEYPDGKREGSISEKVLYNKEVNKVQWDKMKGGGVKISCTDGSEYSGAKVLVTIPLGVMKHTYKHLFHPPLPSDNEQAVKTLGYGVMENIYLSYEDKWWPDYNIDFGMTKDMLKEYRANNNANWWVSRLSGFTTLPRSPLIMQAWTYSDAAKDMLKASESDVNKAVKDLLERLFENQNVTVPLANKVARSSWHDNHYSRGSYSYRTVESDRKNITGEDLAKPLVNSDNEAVVLFAGEATDRYYYGTVVGAVRSGLAAAEKYLSLTHTY